MRDKARLENVVTNHLSHLSLKATPNEELPIDIDNSFQNDQLLIISHQDISWYASDKVCGVLPPGLSYPQKKKFLADVKYYVWEEPLLYKLCKDAIYQRCLPEDEFILSCFNLWWTLWSEHNHR